MHYKDAKGILSAKNGMNLYRGCTHGCIYCDSRSVCYQMTHAFEDIEVKRNAPELLEQALKRKKAPCMIVTGSMCDPYMPLEREEKLVRRCLEIICRYGFGFSVITKSDLVLRDLDLLRAIHAKAKCVVQMTLTTMDEDMCRVLEPYVATTKRRIEVLETLRDAGIPTVVWLSPVLPFLNDTEENIRGILACCTKAKVKGIVSFGMGMTLRDGNREYFYQKLDEHFPGLKAQYHKTFGRQYICPSPRERELTEILQAHCQNNGMLWKPGEVFSYVAAMETKTPQLSLF